MPYRQIHWIKLEKRLLNDPRFFLMSQTAQLYYIKLMLLCAEYMNKVPRKYPVLIQLLRANETESELEAIFSEIRANFPKVLAHRDYYYIKGFKKLHNWVLPGNSQGTPKELADKEEDKKKIRSKYITLKAYDWQDLGQPFYKRTGLRMNQLLVLAKGDTNLILSCLDWMSRRRHEWTLETCIKMWPDFMKTQRKPPPRKTEAELDAEFREKCLEVDE